MTHFQKEPSFYVDKHYGPSLMNSGSKIWSLSCSQGFSKIWPSDLVYHQRWHTFKRNRAFICLYSFYLPSRFEMNHLDEQDIIGGYLFYTYVDYLMIYKNLLFKIWCLKINKLFRIKLYYNYKLKLLTIYTTLDKIQINK